MMLLYQSQSFSAATSQRRACTALIGPKPQKSSSRSFHKAENSSCTVHVRRHERIVGKAAEAPPGGKDPNQVPTDVASSQSPQNAPPPSPPSRLLGVDYGTATTGLALGQAGTVSVLQAIPSPRTGRLSDVARAVLEAAQRHGAGGVVVGLPVQPGGSLVKPHTDSSMGARCRALAHSLALLGREAGVEVLLYDERSTTQAAMKTMGYNWHDRMSGQEKKEKRVDAESAAMLLRLYFGNPKLAVRVKPRVNIKRAPKQGSED